MKIDRNALARRQVDALEGIGVEALRDKFSELFGFQPTILNADWLRRRCAYRLQELQFGGLSPDAEEYLDGLVRDDDLARLHPRTSRRYTATRGARFIREWGGVTHEVTVLGPSLFEYGGEKYKSLTAIAKAITGTHWSGRRFFGVEA